VLVFLAPLVFADAAIGLVIGVAVGRKLAGRVGAASLGMLLCLAPLVVAFLGFVWYMKRQGG
jgi:hypothetical protein